MAAIIFDFDGTIADSFAVIVDVFETITGSKTVLTAAQMHELKGKPLQVVARELHVPFWKIPWLLVRGRRLMGRRINDVPLFDGMGKVIEELHAEGHQLFVVSSNSTRNVKRFLKHNHLYSYFVSIRGGVGLFGKPRVLRRLMKRNRFQTDECIYIGDETRDVLSAKSIQLRVIAVEWGFANPSFLRDMLPTAMAARPQDIIHVIDGLK